MKKGTNKKVISGFPTATIDRAKDHKTLSSQPKINDPIQKKDAEIQAEKDKSVLKTKVKPGHGVFETKTFTEEETGAFGFLTRAVREHFKLTDAIYKENISRWDFPHAIGDLWKKHTIKRQYPQPSVKLFIDAFNSKDSQAEINRIKAHMEALGFRYTYFRGGDAVADKDGFTSKEFMKLLFVDRLKPLDPKTLKEPVKIPTTLEQAGVNGVTIQV